ncbi:MAG: D-alanyl-D-alanine carboxypeptidase [Alphaproteobacteria bacterium]|nr:D-alanyl-D-alanine carboxypeptidase [Alphaproteobacteria bacterium]
MFKLATTTIAALMLLCAESLAYPKHTSSIAIDIDSGEFISSESPDTVMYPASLTKVMTLYLTFEAIEKGKLKLSTPLQVSRYAAARSPSKLGVAPGQTITVENAVKAVIVKSANDCATVLAEALAKDEREFAKLMTAKAKKLGMKKTVFKNASGLNNSQQVTTARDMAVLGSAIYHHFPQYYKLFSMRTFTYKGKTIYTHNHILKSFKGADGMKTGYLAVAGYNIITSAKRDGHRILAVTMGHKSIKDRDTKVTQIMDKGLKKIALNKNNAQTTLAKLEIPAPQPKTQPLQIKGTGNWAIQIGAFSNYAKARSYAVNIKKQLPEIKSFPVNVEAVEKNMAVVYRSKITNFTQKDAQDLCNRLKKENKSCIVVKHDKNSQLTLAKK